MHGEQASHSAAIKGRLFGSPRLLFSRQQREPRVASPRSGGAAAGGRSGRALVAVRERSGVTCAYDSGSNGGSGSTPLRMGGGVFRSSTDARIFASCQRSILPVIISLSAIFRTTGS